MLFCDETLCQICFSKLPNFPDILIKPLYLTSYSFYLYIDFVVAIIMFDVIDVVDAVVVVVVVVVIVELQTYPK